jgi:phage gp29-like protein
MIGFRQPERPVSLDSGDSERGQSTIAVEPPIYSWSGWDRLMLVKRALRSLEQGQFEEAAQVVDAMMRDDRVSGVLGTLSGVLPALPLSFKDGSARAAKALTPELFEKMLPDAEVSKLVRWGVTLNMGIAQLQWDTSTPEMWTFKLHVWHPRWVHWRYDTQSYWVQTENLGPVEVTPGDGTWIVFAPYGYRNAWMEGAIRALYVPWLLRQYAMRDWGRYGEKHGLMPIKAYTPSSAEKEDKDRFVRAIANLASETVLRCPTTASGDKYDAELLEAAGDTYGTFRDVIKFASDSIAIRLLGQNLTTEVEGGAYAAAKVHQSIRNDVLRALVNALSSCLKEQAIAPWAQYNFGSRQAAPTPSWKTDPPEDLAAKGEGWSAIAKGMADLRAEGIQVDRDTVVAEAGIPTTGPAAEPEPPKPEPDDGKGELSAYDRLPPGARAGQEYLDDMITDAMARGPLAAQVDKLKAMVEGAKDLPSLMAALADDTGLALDSQDFALALQRALTLAELKGRQSVREDVGSKP